MANGDSERTLTLRQVFDVDQPSLNRNKAAVNQYTQMLANLEAQDKKLQAQEARSAGALHAQLLQQGKDAKQIALAMANYHQAINEVAEGNRFLEQTLERENNALQETANRFREKIATARASITTDTEQTRVIQEQTRALERYQAVVAQQQQLATAALPDPTLEAVTGAGGGRQRRNRLGALGTFGTAVRNLPDVGPSTEISNILIGFDRITQSMGLTASAAATTGGLLAVAAAGIVALNAALEPGRVATRNFIATIKEYTRVVLTEGKSAIQEQLDQAREDLRVAQAERDRFRDDSVRRQQEIVDRFGGRGGFGDQALGAALLFNAEGLRELQDAANTADAEVRKLEGDIEFLEEQLVEGAGAGREMADAIGNRLNSTVENFTTLVSNFVDENDQRIRAQIDATNAELQFNQRALDLRRTGSLDQLNQLQQQITDEYTLNQERIRRLQNLAGRSSAADEELEKLNARQAELIQQTQTLTREVEPLIQQREREAALAAALTAQVDQYLSVLEQQGALQQKVFDTGQALNNFLAQSAAREAEIEQDAREKRFKAKQEHEAALQEQEQRAAEDEIKALREHSRRKDEINRAANFTIEEAERNRDVAAARAAARRRDEELRKNDLTLQDRLETLDDNLQKQKETLEKRQREQLQTIEDTARKALDAERKRAREQLTTLQRAHLEAQTQLRNNLNAQALMQQSHFQQTQSMTSSAFTNIANTIGSGLATAQTYFSNFVNGVFQQAQQAAIIGPQPNRIGAGYVPPPGNPFTNIPFQFLPQPAPPPTVAPYQVYQQSGLGRAPYSPTINAPTTGALEQRVLEDLRRIMRTR